MWPNVMHKKYFNRYDFMIKNAVANLKAMVTHYGAPNYQLYPYLQRILGKVPHRGNETDRTLSLHTSIF